MSEWKWCESCEHHYRAHIHEGKSKFGACTIEGCGCPSMSWDLSDI